MIPVITCKQRCSLYIYMRYRCAQSFPENSPPMIYYLCVYIYIFLRQWLIAFCNFHTCSITNPVPHCEKKTKEQKAWDYFMLYIVYNSSTLNQVKFFLTNWFQWRKKKTLISFNKESALQHTTKTTQKAWTNSEIKWVSKWKLNASTWKQTNVNA